MVLLELQGPQISQESDPDLQSPKDPYPSSEEIQEQGRISQIKKLDKSPFP